MVGDLIRERRLAKGLSQPQLAEILGKSQRQISRWEGYTTEMPREATRLQLGAALGIAEREWHLAAARHAPPEVPAAEPDDRPRRPPAEDAPFDVGQIVAYLKAHPDPTFRERLARREERMAPDAFARICLRIYRAQGSNFRAIVETAEEIDGEPWQEPAAADGERDERS